MSKEMYIFDLDDTLILKNNEEYKINIVEKIKQLKKFGKKISLVTFNSYPDEWINSNEIEFDYVYKPDMININEEETYMKGKNKFEFIIWVIGNQKKICRNKSKVIEEMLEKFKIDPNNAIFFDDYYRNIESVSKIGVESILVNPSVGIPYKYLNLN